LYFHGCGINPENDAGRSDRIEGPVSSFYLRNDKLIPQRNWGIFILQIAGYI
jgi:hypothetical protein